LQARYDLEMSEGKDGELIERQVKELARPGSRA
jgi:hypothetical protein